MNERDEELARSIDPDAWWQLHKDDMNWCQQFADLVRADERESCAHIADQMTQHSYLGSVGRAIRARGNT